jgi:hypothetical protein
MSHNRSIANPTESDNSRFQVLIFTENALRYVGAGLLYWVMWPNPKPSTTPTPHLIELKQHQQAVKTSCDLYDVGRARGYAQRGAML